MDYQLWITSLHTTKTASKLNSLNINVSNWASSLPIAKYSQLSVSLRTAEAQQKCVARKARVSATSTTAPAHVYPMCGREPFPARIGLSSHLRTHSHGPSTWPGVMVILDPDGRTTPHCSLLSHVRWICNPQPWIINTDQLWITSLQCFPVMDSFSAIIIINCGLPHYGVLSPDGFTMTHGLPAVICAMEYVL